MKFFFALLPLVLGSASCTDHHSYKPVTEPQTVSEFVRSSVRYIEPYHGNHVIPVDSPRSGSYYRQYYAPLAPTYPGHSSRPTYVEVVPSYGYGAYGHGFGYPYSPHYQQPYLPHHGPYYRPYSSVLYREVLPVHVPGEHHSHKHSSSGEQVTVVKQPSVIAVHAVNEQNHFGMPKEPVRYVEDSVASASQVVAKKVQEPNSVVSGPTFHEPNSAVSGPTFHERSSSSQTEKSVPAVSASETSKETSSQIHNPVVAETVTQELKPANRFPFPSIGKKKPAVTADSAKVFDANDKEVPSETSGVTGETVVEVKKTETTVVSVGTVQEDAQTGSESAPEAVQATKSSESQSVSVPVEQVTPILMMPFEMKLPVVPGSEPVLMTNEPAQSS